MNVGYYFHVPAAFEGEHRARIRAHYGLVIAELARQAGRATYYAHDAPTSGTEDFLLEEPAVRCVNLGPRRTAPARTFVPGPDLQLFDPAADGIDVLVIRSPTPLLPHLVKACRARGIPVALHLVNDLRTWRPGSVNAWWRNAAIWTWIRASEWRMARAARHTLVLANNPEPLRGKRFPRTGEAITSTVPEAALRELGPPDLETFGRGTDGRVRLLYTGRLVEDKGLQDAVRALAILVSQGLDVELEIVGWTAGQDVTSMRVAREADALGVGGRLVASGYRTAGLELMRAYRDADIFVMPMWGEGGSPDSIKEALAAGTPSVVTRVPGIAEQLVDGREVVFVEPRSPEALAGGIRRLIEDAELRRSVAAGGWRWAQGVTVERAIAQMLDHLRGLVDGAKGVRA